MKLDKRLHSLAAHWKSFCQNRTQDEWERRKWKLRSTCVTISVLLIAASARTVSGCAASIAHG